MNNNNGTNITISHSPSPPPKPNRINSNTLNPKKANLFMYGDYSPVRENTSDRKVNVFFNRDQSKTNSDPPNSFKKSENVEFTYRDSPTCEKLSNDYNKMIQSSDFSTSTVN